VASDSSVVLDAQVRSAPVALPLTAAPFSFPAIIKTETDNKVVISQNLLLILRSFIARLLFDEGYNLGWRDNCHRSIRTPILECPILDIQNPTTSGIHRWGDSSISNPNDALSSSKLAGCPKPDVAARR